MEIPIIQIGVGGVGGALVRQLLAQQETLQQRYGFKVGYLALVERSGAVYTGEMLSPDTVEQALQACAARSPLADLPNGHAPGDWQRFLPPTPCIVADVTAASGLEDSLVAAVQAGHRLVFANKRPLTSTQAVFDALTARGATRYEVTVGAGLPVIDTLQRLMDSGDTLIRIQAAMSGTLGYLCGALQDGEPLSQAVRFARSNGWTEPDPRDDLSGADVARKALILARTCGLPWDIAHVTPEAWFPPDMADISIDAFMERVGELDAPFAERVAQASASNQVLRYVATIEPTGASVALQALPTDHPLAALRGTDNMLVLTTARYSDPMPQMVIRGPGAGIAVTAAGVFGDIIATARDLATG
jgi:homoserine dehydrogenase